MGCDGGTIPRRNELVKVKKNPERKDKDSELSFHWHCCSISQEILQHPIVVCGLGRLYSKVALIEALINRSTLPETASHIRSLKDVIDLNLTVSNNDGDDDKSNNVASATTYVCPVTGLEMSGKYRFVALWRCGCVFSERALKEIKSNCCLKCLQTFDEDDVVVINGNEDDVLLMKVKMKKRLELRKYTKTHKSLRICVDKGNITKSNAGVDCNSCKFLIGTDNLRKRSGALIDSGSAESKLSKPSYRIAEDPEATDVYKSIFTVSED